DDDDDNEFANMLFRSIGKAPKRIVLPEGKTDFPFSFSSFLQLRSAETLYLNASIKKIPDRIRRAAASLRSIKVPDANPYLRSIDGVLYSKDGKTLLLYPRRKADRNFSVPEPVRSIAPYAFCQCVRLRSILFPNTLRTLGKNTIVECPNLRAIHLPRLIKTIHHKAFSRTNLLERIEVLGTLFPAEEPRPAEEKNTPAQERYRSVDGVLYTGDLKRLVRYPSGRDDSHFDVPETVEVIGRGAFQSSVYLRSIRLGASVREIETVCKPIDTPPRKNASPFHGCALLKSFDVDPANPIFRAIDGVLYKNNARVLVSYPPAKRDDTFRIPDSVEVIAPCALAGNKFLERVIFPNSVRTIEQGAFLSCKNLRGVTLPDSLRSIGDRAFAECKSLLEIRIPKSVRGFERCFDDCSSLRRVDVDPENPFFRGGCGVLFSKDLTHLIFCPAAWPRKSAVVPDQVTTIEAGAFADCTILRAIKVPATVRVIEDRAFRRPFFLFLGASQTIYAEKDSAARDYAKENHIKAADIDDFPEEDFFG
ncbi:MAG: leucine-rich repeat protein, partial [Thermoguttaceae bacterium]|nr:leucine-rich repeat protein [Thermoguttaceae bacterium]